jgi:hypothetical protein
MGTDVSKANADAVNTQMLARLDATTRLQLGQLDASTRMEVAKLDAANRLLLQSNQSAAQMFNQTVTDITNISTNPNLAPDAKKQAVDNALALLQQGLTMTGNVSNLNLGQYFEDVDFVGGAEAFKGTEQVTQSNFDWPRYLADNPDVAQWVSTLANQSPEGLQAGAWSHYKNYGGAEGRKAYSA